MPTRLKTADLKRYSLELYGAGGAEDLLIKLDSDDPFTPMQRGDRLQPMDLAGASPDLLHEIIGIEHLIWTAGDQVRYVTRVYTRPAPPLG
jgi:hypothetical protein